jgi:hypothetical protein
MEGNRKEGGINACLGMKTIKQIGLSKYIVTALTKYYGTWLISVPQLKKDVKSGKVSHLRTPKIGIGAITEIQHRLKIPTPKKECYLNPHTEKLP